MSDSSAITDTDRMNFIQQCVDSAHGYAYFDKIGSHNEHPCPYRMEFPVGLEVLHEGWGDDVRDAIDSAMKEVTK